MDWRASSYICSEQSPGMEFTKFWKYFLLYILIFLCWRSRYLHKKIWKNNFTFKLKRYYFPKMKKILEELLWISSQCGKIRMRDKDVIIVVGGFQGSSSLWSSEIYDAENNIWIEGGKDRSEKSKTNLFT